VGTRLFRFVTNHVFATQTERTAFERETAFSWLYRAWHYMQSHSKNETPFCDLQQFSYSLSAFKVSHKLEICKLHGASYCTMF